VSTGAEIAGILQLGYKDSVMQRRILGIAVLILVAFAAQAVRSPAAQALQQMRAARCCKENCQHPQSFTSPMRCGCCQIAAAANSDSAAMSGKPQLSAPAVIASMGTDFALPSAGGATLVATSASPRAAPLFLLTLNIRL
jgi:hypothetical protein